MKLFSITKVDLSKEDKENLKEFYLYHKQLKAIADKLTKADKFERGLLHSKLRSVRDHLEGAYTSTYEVASCFKGNKPRFFSSFISYPSTEDLRMHLRQARSQINAERKHLRFIGDTTVEYNGITYKKKGGVFTTEKSIIDLKLNTTPSTRINKTKRPSSTFKANYLGIEFEFLTKLDVAAVQEKFIAAKLEGYVHVGTDGSVSESGYRGLEVRLLVNEYSAKDIIVAVCKVLREDCQGHVNNTCGLHVHFDMRNRNASHCYNNMVKILPLLSKMVPQTRISGESVRYCKLNTTPTLDTQLSNGDRYYAINAQSISEHTTLEVRLHSGTLNAAKVYNWIQVILTAINAPEVLKSKVGSPSEFADTFEVSNKLVEYIQKRVDTFTASVDTRTDDSIYINYELCA